MKQGGLKNLEGSAKLESDSGTSSSGSENDTTAHHKNSRIAYTQGIPLGHRLVEQKSGISSFKQPRASLATKAQKLDKGKLTKYNETFAAKRENKNRPTEQSSKRRISRLRDVLQVPRTHFLDPRFDVSAGQFKADVFKKGYSFLYEETLPQEQATLRREIKKTKSLTRKRELQDALAKIKQEISKDSNERRVQELAAKAKAKEKKAVKAGKKPYYLKASEKKEQELIARYHDLKATGRLQKALAKKRRKNASKDHRYIPSGRRKSK